MEIDVVKLMQACHDSSISPELSAELIMRLGFSLEEMLAHVNDMKCEQNCIPCVKLQFKELSTFLAD